MPFIRWFAIAILLGAVPAVSVAQKPQNSGKKMRYAHTTGTGTPASLSHHKDNSAAFLHENTRSSHAAELNRIEQQSLRVPAATSKQARVRAASPPKLGAAKPDKNVAINFSGRAQAHNLTTTKSAGKSPATSARKPH